MGQIRKSKKTDENKKKGASNIERQWNLNQNIKKKKKKYIFIKSTVTNNKMRIRTYIFFPQSYDYPASTQFNESGICSSRR
jgi:hypothetical protein